MASLLDINATFGPICPENLTKYGWSYDDVHRIYTKPIYNTLIYSNFSLIDPEFLLINGLPNIAFAYISIHWDYPMFRETHERLPLAHIEQKPTFKFGIRGYELGSAFSRDIFEPECVRDMGDINMLFNKWRDNLLEAGVPEKYFINLE